MRKRRPRVGAPPGELAKSESPLPAKITAYTYGPDSFSEKEVSTLSELEHLCKNAPCVWVDVQGLDDEPVLRRLAEIFSIHPLSLADAVNTPQRPKAESFDTHTTVVTYMVRCTDKDPSITLEQLTLVFGKNFVVSFQERDYHDVLDPVRERLRSGKGPLRHNDAAYLAYAMIDVVVDAFFPVLEKLGEDLEQLEDQIFNAPTTQVLHAVQKLRRTLLTIRRVLWPQRDLLSALLRDDSPFNTPSLRPHMRDCYDHAVQLLDMLETYRELAAGLGEAYMSGLSNRMNEIMKVLTMISTIFIPLSFIAGVYGMNFDYMPELRISWAYPAVLGVMAAIGVGMLGMFVRRGWFR